MNNPKIPPFTNELIDSPSKIDKISLTEAQSKAVYSQNKNIAVIAGPGSGKTRVLTERIVHLINDNDDIAEKILALSFSSKAAKEMKRRLKERLGNRSYKVEVKTFHSFGLQIIRNNFDLLGLSQEFELLTPSNKYRILRDILKDNNISEKEILKYSQDISRIKNGETIRNAKLLEIREIYDKTLHRADTIDFDDMVSLALQVLNENSDVASSYRNYYLHILVDEVQDLNKNQTELIKLLVGKHTSLFVVGDDDQCIYEWRGARPDYLKNLVKDSAIEVFRLEDNFRSNGAIVDISSSLINNNQNRINKWMRSRKEEKKLSNNAKINAGSTKAMRFNNEIHEANYISSEIKELHELGRSYSDFAILVRSARQTPAIKDALQREGIPFVEQVNDESEYDEILPILKAILRIDKNNAINRAINYPTQIMDNFLFMDLQEKFQIDKLLSVFKSFERLANGDFVFDDSDSFRARFSLLVELNSSYTTLTAHQIILKLYDCYSKEPFAKTKKAQEKLEHLKTLLEISKGFDEVYANDKSNKSQFEDFLDYLALSSQDNSTEESENIGVNIMTCHKSKGLEFPIVFIPGVQVGIFPNDFFITSADDIEAERRLFYVSMTRAIEKLYVTCSANPFAGKGLVKKGFMAEIPGVSIK